MDRKRSTIQDYRGYLRGHLEPFFGERPIDRIDPAQGRRLPQAQARGRPVRKTVQNHLNFLHGVFAFSLKRGWDADQSGRATSTARRRRARHTDAFASCSHRELDELIGAVPDDSLGAVERPLYLAAALTGLRQGELLALKWMDVDWLAAACGSPTTSPAGSSTAPKSHEGRSVPMADRLARELEASRPALAPTAQTTTSSSATPTPAMSSTRRRCASASARRSPEAGVHEITFHELRHTFGTQMAAAGAPLRAIQEWMGHADAKTTEIYRHYAPDPTNGARWSSGRSAQPNRWRRMRAQRRSKHDERHSRRGDD